MKSVALFGGSFDPPHIGHIAVVEALKQLSYIDEIVVMPTYINPFKNSSYASPKQRFDWLVEIFKDDTKVVVSDYEVAQNKKTPTIESVRHLRKTYKKIYLVLGADNLDSLQQWYKYNELKELVSFIIATRDGAHIPLHFTKIEVEEEIASSTLREKLDKNKLPQQCADEILQFYKGYNEKKS